MKALAILSYIAVSYAIHLGANETEILAVASVQAGPSLTAFKNELFGLVSAANRFQSVPGIFAQQDGVIPAVGEVQLYNFGAKLPWPKVLEELTAVPNRVLLVMIRHGEAWENVNPLSNDHCQFPYQGSLIDNIDSDLDDAGVEQARTLNDLLRSAYQPATNNTKSWFEALGLSNKVLHRTFSVSVCFHTYYFAAFSV